MQTVWRVIFYINKDDSEPVKDFILAQTKGARSEIIHVLELLKDFNVNLKKPHVRKVHKSGIRELRIKHGSEIFRIFFFAYQDRRFVLLHAITKKTDKTPPGDITIAVNRMNDHISRNT